MPLELELCPGRWVGGQHPCFIIAEIGQNHQGDLDVAKRMIRMAKVRGASRGPGRRVPSEGGAWGRVAWAWVGGAADPGTVLPLSATWCLAPGLATSKCFESSSFCYPPDLFALLQLTPNLASLALFWWQNNLPEKQI